MPIPSPHLFATALPGDWTTRQSPHVPGDFTATRESDGLTLYVGALRSGHALRGQVGRIEAVLREIPINHGGPSTLCVWPHEVRDPVTHDKMGAAPRITVGRDTSAKDLAWHVVRRLLPDAERFHAAMLAEREQIRDTQNKRAAAVALLKSAGVRFGDGSNGSRTDTTGSVYPEVPGYLIVNDYGGVRFDRLDVTAEQAVRIVNALRTVPA